MRKRDREGRRLIRRMLGLPMYGRVRLGPLDKFGLFAYVAWLAWVWWAHK